MAPAPGAGLLLSCEHGGNAVPREYRGLFRGRRGLLGSHRGLDLGALAAARELERRLGAPLIAATVTRLLVDLNRSLRHPGLFSEITRGLSRGEREAILARYYRPYRALVAAALDAVIARQGRVLHLSVHSFTPVMAGEARRADVGLLYDPARTAEARLCREWQAGLAACEAGWTVRRNYPYRGTSDGQVVTLRGRFGRAHYCGIELEINQACLAQPRRRARLLADLAATFPG